MKYHAIEKSSDVKKAVTLFQNKIESGCNVIGGFPKGSTSWNPRLGFWSHFQKWKRQDGTDRYWNGFGFQTDNVRRRVIVEINPPVQNMYKGMQGVVARTTDGSNWILHRGGLSIPDRHITEEDFETQSSLKRVIVEFTDGRKLSCFPIAMLDDNARAVQTKLLRYLNECKRIRHLFMYGEQIADFENKTSDLDEEPAVNPEMTASYMMPKQAAKIIERKHAKVWNALAAELKKMHLPHTNERIGRWGPDLVILGKNVLFEIKITTEASDVQKALGQLLLYEALIAKKLTKILVIPSKIHIDLQRIFQDMDISFLYYTENNGRIGFDSESLRRAIR